MVTDKANYFIKLENIIYNRSKFKYLGPVEKHDKTEKVETNSNKLPGQFKDREEVSENTYNPVHPYRVQGYLVTAFVWFVEYPQGGVFSPTHPSCYWFSRT